MTAAGQANPVSQLKMLWLSLLGSPVMIWIALIAMSELTILPEIEFNFADYVFYTGLVLILPAAFLLRSFKKINRSYLELSQLPDQAGPAQDKVRINMMIGMMVADAPATLSIIYFVMTGDIEKSVVLVASSFILCLFFKPDLPRHRSD